MHGGEISVCCLYVMAHCVITDKAPPGGIARLSTNSSQSVSSPPSSAAARADLPPAGGDNEEEERMKHLQQVSIPYAPVNSQCIV